MANPFFTYAGLLERTTHLIHSYLRNDPMVTGYQFWGQTSINDAYGNPAASGVGGAGAVALFEVSRGASFRSSSIRRTGRDLIEENRRGTTHAIWDMDDFVGAGVSLPPDDKWLYLMVQENREAGLLTLPGPLPVLGPIFCVPPAVTSGVSEPTFTLQAIAPSGVVGAAAGSPPPFDEDLTTAAPRPMYLVFPYPLIEFTIHNHDVANTLLISFGPGQPMKALGPGLEMALFSGTTKAFILACPDAGGCEFSVHGVMGRG